MAKPWLGKVGALFHYMHSLPMDMKRGCIGILIHPLYLIFYFAESGCAIGAVVCCVSNPGCAVAGISFFMASLISDP